MWLNNDFFRFKMSFFYNLIFLIRKQIDSSTTFEPPGKVQWEEILL